MYYRWHSGPLMFPLDEVFMRPRYRDDVLFPRTVQFLVVIAVSLLFAGCGSNNGSSSSAQLRTINASGQQQDLDVLLDSTSFQTSILSETASAYATESSGNHTIQVEPSGTTTTLI